MQSWTKALADEREALSVPFPSLGDVLRIVPGTLIDCLGAPGVGKSLFALNWALRLSRPTRIFSLDTDPLTQAARTVAALRNIDVNDVLNGNRAEHAAWLEAADLPFNVLDQPVKPSEVFEVLRADQEYWGEFPSLVIVDDVSKLALGERGYADYDNAFRSLHLTARATSSLVLALHHLHRGGNSAGEQRVQLSDGKYTGEYEAEIVLGLWRPNPFVLQIGVLKNRSGPSDPSGGLTVEFQADYAKAKINDYRPRTETLRQADSPVQRVFSEDRLDAVDAPTQGSYDNFPSLYS